MEKEKYPIFMVVDMMEEFNTIDSITFKGGIQYKSKSNKKLMLLKNKTEGMVLNDEQIKAIKFLLECMKELQSNINPADLSLMITELIKKRDNN